MTFVGMRLRWAAVASMLAGCAPARYVSSYERCLAHPEEWREGVRREGGWHPRLAFGFGDWGASYGYVERLRVTERVEHCRHVVTAELEGRPFESRPYGYVDHFVTDVDGHHLAFVGSDAKAYVVVDGVESQPWDEVLWPPTFSANGVHLAYLARDGQGGALVVDGQIVRRAPGFVPNNFRLGDDGSAAAVQKTADGGVEVVLGARTSGRFDDVCALSFVLGPAGRFAFVGRRGNHYLGVVDFQEIPAPGIPTGCDIVFSADGSRFAYATRDDRREFDTGKAVEVSRYALVLDGSVQPLSASGSIARLAHDLAVVAIDEPSSRILWVVGTETPEVAPVDDGYRPPASQYSTPRAVRVRLGDSLGPAFDEVELPSFTHTDDGHVRYVGLRGGSHYPVVDNVIVTDRPTATVAQ